MPFPAQQLLALSESDKERFWSKVEKAGPEECWEWNRFRTKFGYGRFWVNRKNFNSHRVAFFLDNGSIDESLLVLHKCNNPPCCNPVHLRQGTYQDNVDDMISAGRSATGARNGHSTMPWRTLRGDENGSRTHPECLKRGVEQHLAKLNDEIVYRMRSERKETGIRYSKLGIKYGVTKTAARLAVAGKTWAHVKFP